MIVGRDDALTTVRDGLAAAHAGRGGTVFLVGESGIGKSRLISAATDLAFGRGMRVLRGRGSAIGPLVPFRSLTEALLSLLRSGDPVDVTALGPYRPVLAALVPDWQHSPAERDVGSVVILAEAVLRLIGLAGNGRGCLLTLDDLQDTDAETLAVVEYLIDNLDQQPTLLIGTIRDDSSPALRLAQSVAQRNAATLVELVRLNTTELGELAGSCLRVPASDVPRSARDLLWAGSAGNPFLAEELLDGMIDSGLLVPEGGAGWTVAERPRANPPATLVRSIARRVELLAPAAREALSAAAVLGRQIPLAVLREVTGLEYRELLSHLHGEGAGQLVTPDDETPDRYVFRHSLIREGLLTLLAPGERANLAKRVAHAVETVYPGLPGEWCQVCAGLRLDAGQIVPAGRLFAEAGRRALAQGAAHSAVALLDKAWELLATDAPARIDALGMRLHALTEAGQMDRALADIGMLDEVGAELDQRSRAQMHIRLAWAANICGRTADGLNQVEIARALLGKEAPAEDTARLDVVAAHLVTDVPGPDQLRAAEAMARRGAAVAEAVPLPDVACQAWQVVGAVVRTRDPAEATVCLERSRSIAVQYDLPIWEIHALVRLGTDDALREGTIDRLEQVRVKAARAGAVVAQYWAEATIALYQTLYGDFEAAEALNDEVLAVSTRLRLLQLTQYLLINRAILASHRGRRHDMDGALAELRQWDGDLAYNAPRLHGLARTFCALLEEDRPLAMRELGTGLRAEERNPTIFLLVGRYGLDLLLRAVSGELDFPAYRAVAEDPAAGLRWDRQFALFAQAVLAGRSGQPDVASSVMAEAMHVGAPFRMGRHLGLRLVAEAALADGWGTPVEWLQLAEEYFHNAAVPAVAGECRRMLRGAGARLTPRRFGVGNVPSGLRATGITVREYEVLLLLVERLGNQEIADQLNLSLRTVEKHVSSLIAKTGKPNRVALSKFGAAQAGR